MGVAPTELTAFDPPSSVLRGFSWQILPGNAAGVLSIGFPDGSTWHYAGVPERVFEDFLLAKSRGRYFYTRIKPIYEGNKEIVDESRL